MLDPHIQGLRDRSSSFGSRSRLGGSGSLLGSHSASRSSKFDDLSSSWQNLQKQVGEELLFVTVCYTVDWDKSVISYFRESSSERLFVNVTPSLVYFHLSIFIS